MGDEMIPLLPAPRIAGLLPACCPRIEPTFDVYAEKPIIISYMGYRITTNGFRDIGVALAELTAIARQQLTLPMTG